MNLVHEGVLDTNEPDFRDERMDEPICNAAAMREALKTIHDKVNSLNEECGVDPVEIRDIARTALSAPARNCDRFADETDAQIAFLNEVWLISVTKETALERDRFENWTDEMKSTYAKWLLAPEAERKGDENVSCTPDGCYYYKKGENK